MLARPLGLHWSRCDAASIPVGMRVCRALNQQAQGFYEETVPDHVPSTRIDAWIAEQLPNASRSRVKDSILKGLATVNGRSITKPSYSVEAGDRVVCTLCGAEPLEAKPENIPLDIVHEDEHVIVVNKTADMVVHPAAGHSSGTLVNAILYHCGLPAIKVSSHQSDDEELAEDDELIMFSGPVPVIRPGIVHRLDKGTTGLLVVAKNEISQLSLSEQFKARTVQRTYLSLTCGTPLKASDRIEAAIARDPRDRKRMATVDSTSISRRARFAASRYEVLDVVANGGCALVEWKLETGRTHQIRVHARYIGYPILGDEVYGGTTGLAVSRLVTSLQSGKSNTRRNFQDLVAQIQRPALHAYSLGFKHPATKEQVHFTCPPPSDFEELWRRLKELKAD